jgi:hypothetical protein
MVELLWHPMKIYEIEQLWHNEGRRRERGYEGEPGCEKLHKVCRYIQAQQECVRNITNCVDL